MRPLVAASCAVAALVALAGCSGESAAALSRGEAATLAAAEPLGVTLTVLGAEEVGDDVELTDLGGGALDGVPWQVDYRIDMTSGSRQDFSWDAVPAVSSSQWSARDSGGAKLTAAHLTGTASSLCNGTAEPPESDDVVGTYCQIFIVRDGETLDRVELAEVGTWDLGG